MIRKVFFPCLLLTGVLTSGCALFLVGAGVAGGVAISEDTVQGHSDASYQAVWDSVVKVLAGEGFIKTKNESLGTVEAEVSDSKVEVTIDQVTPQTVQISVKARKISGLFPDLKLAQRLYDRILKELD